MTDACGLPCEYKDAPQMQAGLMYSFEKKHTAPCGSEWLQEWTGLCFVRRCILPLYSSNTVTKPDWGAKRWNPGKGEEIEEDVMVIDDEMENNPCVIPCLTQRKAKTLQQHLPPRGQPPIQETFMMRKYTPTKLID